MNATANSFTTLPLMKSEDYIALEASHAHTSWSWPLSKKRSLAISTAMLTVLGLSVIVAGTLGQKNTASAATAFEQRQYSFEPLSANTPRQIEEDDLTSETLAEVFSARGSGMVDEDDADNVLVTRKAQVLDNYDDAVPEIDLADADEQMDKDLRTLAAQHDKAPRFTENKWFEEDVQQGDTLYSLFSDLNIPQSTIEALMVNTQVSREAGLIKPGERVSFLISENNRLQAFVKPLGAKTQLRFFRDGERERFLYAIEPLGAHLQDQAALESPDTAPVLPVAAKVEAAQPPVKAVAAVAKTNVPAAVPHDKRGRLVVVNIKKGDTFSAAANRMGLSYQEINKILHMFKGRIQFSKSVQPGDTMRVLFTEAKGKGKISAVEFKLKRGGKIATYLNPGDNKYYDEKGFNSARSSMRRFPIDRKVVISSPFNPHRHHPVTGQIRPHNGTDFAVPVGTKVLAAADGIVDKAAYSPSAGNYVVLRHRGSYSTVYMHLSKLSVKAGQRVKMGSVIALSGNTGMSTGPHLHYELRINGRPVNAMRVNLGAMDAELNSKERKRFTASVQQYKKDLYKEALIAKL